MNRKISYLTLKSVFLHYWQQVLMKTKLLLSFIKKREEIPNWECSWRGKAFSLCRGRKRLKMARKMDHERKLIEDILKLTESLLVVAGVAGRKPFLQALSFGGVERLSRRISHFLRFGSIHRDKVSLFVNWWCNNFWYPFFPVWRGKLHSIPDLKVWTPK